MTRPFRATAAKLYGSRRPKKQPRRPRSRSPRCPRVAKEASKVSTQIGRPLLACDCARHWQHSWQEATFLVNVHHAQKAAFFWCRLATRPTRQHTGLHPQPRSKNQAGHSSKGVACCPGQPRQLLLRLSAATTGRRTSIWDGGLQLCPCVAAGCAGSAGCKWHRVRAKSALHVGACLAPMFSCHGKACSNPLVLTWVEVNHLRANCLLGSPFT